MRHHGGQNVVESQGATERVHNKFLPQYFYHNIKVKENAFFFTARAEKGVA